MYSISRKNQFSFEHEQFLLNIEVACSSSFFSVFFDMHVHAQAGRQRSMDA